MAWAERSETSASPLEGWSQRATIGNPEAPGAGVSDSEGAEPPSAGAGAAGAPNLDTYGTTQPAKPSRSALFGPLWLTLDEYREGVAAELRNLALYHVAHGKRRRNFVKKARSLLSCGQFARVQRCGTCGALDAATAIVECACDLRRARRVLGGARTSRAHAWKQSGARARGPATWGCYLLTFTSAL
jgi:hypothetical protein